MFSHLPEVSQGQNVSKLHWLILAPMGTLRYIPQIDLKTWGTETQLLCIPIVGIFFSPLENSAVYFHSKVFGMCYGGF